MPSKPSRTRSMKLLSDSWNKKIRKAIKNSVRDQQERNQYTKLLNRPAMKLALGSLLVEIKNHPKPEGDSENDRLRLILNVLNQCVISQLMPKDIPNCLRSTKALKSVAAQTEELAARFGDLAKAGLVIGTDVEGKIVDFCEIANLLVWLSQNLQSIASNPETLQIISAGMFHNLKPGQGNRPDLRVWRLIHGLAIIFFYKLGNPQYKLVAMFHNAIFKNKRSGTDVEKIHTRMMAKGMIPPPHPGHDGSLTAV